MVQPAFPALQIVCDRLNQSPSNDHFVIWATATPFVRGYAQEDVLWDEQLSRIWLAWQAMFTPTQTPHYPIQNVPVAPLDLTPDPQISLSSRLMQSLGVQLWQWLFPRTIAASLARAEGVALGQKEALRLRLDIRDPNLLPLPWEIMQAEMGKQAISLEPNLFFSRTIGDVNPLQLQDNLRTLNILCLVGQPEHQQGTLDLSPETAYLQHILQTDDQHQINGDILIEPDLQTLITTLNRQKYHVLIYSGHGEPAADGGQIHLNKTTQINGKELAQLLRQNGIRLAVFNSCWGAKSYQHHHQAIAASSLSEVLIHHGLPAVIAMRDPINDVEALTFIQSLMQALSDRCYVDQAVAIARQTLLTRFKFNSPVWTLPILYLHPEFDGKILPHLLPITELPTQLPQPISAQTIRLTSLQSPERQWTFQSKLIRIGRRSDNDMSIEEQWVSKEHAEIIQRDDNYILRDSSRFGTLIAYPNEPWRIIHQEEFPLKEGCQICFGSEQGEHFMVQIQRPPAPPD